MRQGAYISRGRPWVSDAGHRLSVLVPPSCHSGDMVPVRALWSQYNKKHIT